MYSGVGRCCLLSAILDRASSSVSGSRAIGELAWPCRAWRPVREESVGLQYIRQVGCCSVFSSRSLKSCECQALPCPPHPPSHRAVISGCGAWTLWMGPGQYVAITGPASYFGSPARCVHLVTTGAVTMRTKGNRRRIHSVARTISTGLTVSLYATATLSETLLGGTKQWPRCGICNAFTHVPSTNACQHSW